MSSQRNKSDDRDKFGKVATACAFDMSITNVVFNDREVGAIVELACREVRPLLSKTRSENCLHWRWQWKKHFNYGREAKLVHAMEAAPSQHQSEEHLWIEKKIRASPPSSFAAVSFRTADLGSERDNFPPILRSSQWTKGTVLNFEKSCPFKAASSCALLFLEEHFRRGDYFIVSTVLLCVLMHRAKIWRSITVCGCDFSSFVRHRLKYRLFLSTSCVMPMLVRPDISFLWFYMPFSTMTARSAKSSHCRVNKCLWLQVEVFSLSLPVFFCHVLKVSGAWSTRRSRDYTSALFRRKVEQEDDFCRTLKNHEVCLCCELQRLFKIWNEPWIEKLISMKL